MSLHNYWSQPPNEQGTIREQVQPSMGLPACIDTGNPMVVQHGPGPDGRRCKDCAHLVAFAQSRPVYKCRERTRLTHSARTDQRLSWPACAKFEPRAEGKDIPLYDGR